MYVFFFGLGVMFHVMNPFDAVNEVLTHFSHVTRVQCLVTRALLIYFVTTIHFRGTPEGFTVCLQLVGGVWEEINYKTMILLLCQGLVNHHSLTAEVCVWILGQYLWKWWQTEWHWNRFLSEWFSFPILVSFHHCFILLFDSFSFPLTLYNLCSWQHHSIK